MKHLFVIIILLSCLGLSASLANQEFKLEKTILLDINEKWRYFSDGIQLPIEKLHLATEYCGIAAEDTNRNATLKIPGSEYELFVTAFPAGNYKIHSVDSSGVAFASYYEYGTRFSISWHLQKIKMAIYCSIGVDSNKKNTTSKQSLLKHLPGYFSFQE